MTDRDVNKARVAPGRKKPIRKKKSKKQDKTKKILKGIGLGMLFCFLAVFVVASGYVFSVIKNTDPLDVEAVLSLSQPTTIYDSDGVLLDNVATSIERYVVSSDEIPTTLKNAYVSIEDERFYEHGGVDIRRIIGAAVTDVKKLLKGESGFHGASTLTQQLLKNTILTDESSLERKIKEIYLAGNLEDQLSKDEIITAYLNTIPLGGTVYGVEAASRYYFAKNVSDLSLIECAYLAGITQAPTYYMAYNEVNMSDPTRYVNRTITVLAKMLENGYITESEYDTAVASVNNGDLVFGSMQVENSSTYEWFVDPAIEQVRQDLIATGKSEDEVNKMLANGGLQIYTTMDRELQDYTQEMLNDYDNLGMSGTDDLSSEGVPLLQASATIVDNETNSVVAMIGGRGEQPPKSLNRAYNITRPIGSTTKPLTVYGPGIEENTLTAGTALDDAPLPQNTLDGGSHYDPSNSPATYYGLISVRDAVKYSKNVCAVNALANYVGMETGISYGERLGLVYNDASKSSIAAVALGQFNNSTTDPDGGNTYVLAGAYSTFANGGTYVEPYLYSKVLDSKGNVILDNTSHETDQVFSEQTAYIMYDILKGPVSEGGTGTTAVWGTMPVAGKTGTTTDSKDLWFAGLTPYYTGAVWLGYDTPQKLSAGSSDAAALWAKIMEKFHEGKTVTDIEEPDNIVEVSICKDSGLLPVSLLCSQDQRGDRIYTELFKQGTEPTETCDVHVRADVNITNGLLATENTPSLFRVSKVFIRKLYPNSITDDYQYILPSTYDDTSAPIETEEEEEEEEDKDEEIDDDSDTEDNTDKDNNIDDDSNIDQDYNNGNNNSNNNNNNGNNNTDNSENDDNSLNWPFFNN